MIFSSGSVIGSEALICISLIRGGSTLVFEAQLKMPVKINTWHISFSFLLTLNNSILRQLI